MSREMKGQNVRVCENEIRPSKGRSKWLYLLQPSPRNSISVRYRLIIIIMRSEWLPPYNCRPLHEHFFQFFQVLHFGMGIEDRCEGMQFSVMLSLVSL